MARLGQDTMDRIQRQVAATIALAQNEAGHAEREMKERAPWQDRTSNARNGLRSDVRVTRHQGVSTRIVLAMYHSVDYGVFLELARAGRYAIVGPTADRRRPGFDRNLSNLWGW